MTEQRPAPASWGATDLQIANDFLAREIALALESLRAFETANRQLQAALDTATRERDEARAEVDWLRAEVEKLRAERDALLLDAADFVRWFDRHYPDPSSKPGHPWCVINSRLNAHADTLRALDAGLGLEEKP